MDNSPRNTDVLGVPSFLETSILTLSLYSDTLVLCAAKLSDCQTLDILMLHAEWSHLIEFVQIDVTIVMKSYPSHLAKTFN